MSCFITKPNLPEGKVTTVICGTDDAHILSFFKSNGITVLKNAGNPYIYLSVSTHADMAALYLGSGRILLDKNQITLKNELAKLGFNITETADKIKGAYPYDVKLNFTVVGENVIGKFSCADIRLSELIGDKSCINVKQGYCKCSTLVVNEKAIITDDASIHRSALENGIDSLLVSKGDISLDGHAYGFIGGASGKLSRDIVVFFGDITRHRDFEAIRSFLSEHGCSLVCTDNLKLRDIGGILPIKETI